MVPASPLEQARRSAHPNRRLVVTTLVATIAGFYFGAQTAKGNSAAEASPPASAPKLGPDPKNPTFTADVKGSYVPTLTGTPAPTVSLAEGSFLPPWLHLDSGTGAITGTPPLGTTAADYEVTLIAKNGISPDAQLAVRLSVAARIKNIRSRGRWWCCRRAVSHRSPHRCWSSVAGSGSMTGSVSRCHTFPAPRRAQAPGSFGAGRAGRGECVTAGHEDLSDGAGAQAGAAELRILAATGR